MENQNQNLLEQIEAYLKLKDFKQEQGTESPVFRHQRTINQPGPTMNINGQQIKMPDQELNHIVIVEFFGPGTVDDQDRFEIIRVHIEDIKGSNEVVQSGEFMESLYPEDLDKFKQILEKIL